MPPEPACLFRSAARGAGRRWCTNRPARRRGWPICAPTPGQGIEPGQPGRGRPPDGGEKGAGPARLAAGAIGAGVAAEAAGRHQDQAEREPAAGRPGAGEDAASCRADDVGGAGLVPAGEQIGGGKKRRLTTPGVHGLRTKDPLEGGPDVFGPGQVPGQPRRQPGQRRIPPRPPSGQRHQSPRREQVPRRAPAGGAQQAEDAVGGPQVRIGDPVQHLGIEQQEIFGRDQAVVETGRGGCLVDQRPRPPAVAHGLRAAPQRLVQPCQPGPAPSPPSGLTALPPAARPGRGRTHESKRSFPAV